MIGAVVRRHQARLIAAALMLMPVFNGGEKSDLPAIRKRFRLFKQCVGPRPLTT
jgi:hypothetical protein